MKLVALIILTHGLIACSDSAVHLHEPLLIPEYKMGVTAPALDDPLRSDSPYAGVRLVLIEEQILTSGFDRQSYFEHDDSKFRTVSFKDESDTSDAYKQWLLNNQEIIHAITDTSLLKELFPTSDLIIYDKFSEGDPRMDYAGAFRQITLVMRAESARLWFEGDLSGAIDCIDSLIRLSLLSRDYSTRSVIHALMANAVIAMALEHYQWMIQNPKCTMNARDEISDSLEPLAGSDPVKLDLTTGLNILSIHDWLDRQMAIENGSDELWYTIGALHSTQHVVNQLFEQSLDGKVVSIDQEETIRRVLEELDGITFEDIVQAHSEYGPLAAEVGQSLLSGTAQIERLKVVSDLIDDDNTGISDLLLISSAYRVHRSTLRLIDQRDELLRFLAE